MRRFKNLMRWLNVLLILVTFLSYLSPYISPEQFWPVTFFGMAYPWLLLANLIFAISWLLARNKYALFSIACILMGWSHLTAFWGFHYFSGSTSGSALKIMSYNVQYFYFVRNDKDVSKEAKLEKVSTFIKTIGADILCLQENNDAAAQLPAKSLGYLYLHQEPDKGTAIYSKYPIIKKGQIEFGTKTNSCLWADIKYGEQIFRVYSLHLKSNQVSGLADQVIQKGDLQERETWSDIRGMIGRVKRASAVRVQQAKMVRQHISDSPHPVILCADLNDTPLSHVYHLLSENMRDAFRQKGKGVGTTYAGSIPALRIDYILTSKNVQVLDYDVMRMNYSDHYPVIGTLEY